MTAPQWSIGASGLSAEQANRVLALASTTGGNAEVLDRVERDFGGNAKAADGVARLRELLAVARTAGIPDDRLRIDLAICRGLDYYTGTIYETFLTDLPGIGSVCAGGRYDNLAGLYTKQPLPGVGASLGLDRLLAAMEELNLLPKTSTPAPVLIVQFCGRPARRLSAASPANCGRPASPPRSTPTPRRSARSSSTPSGAASPWP